MTSFSDRDAPSFLAPEPPPWAARGLSTLVLVLFVTAVIVSVTVQLPETVSGTFILVPVRGGDPLRSSREGTIQAVDVTDGQAVSVGQVLFVIRSDPVRDRQADLGTARVQAGGSAAALANARAQYETMLRSDTADLHRMQTHLEYLNALLPIKRQQAQLAQEEANRRRAGVARGVVSRTDQNAADQDAQRLAADVTSTESEAAETRASIAKQESDMHSRTIQYEETVRQLTESRDQARIRATALGADSSDWSQGMLTVRAPCNGTAVRLQVTSPGAIVQAGDVLGDVVCANAPLQAEMRVPEERLAMVRPGQRAKLLYDAFPYQRFGARAGTVRWVGPSGLPRDSSHLLFRALIDVDTPAIAIAGETRPFVAGMAGTANVVVGRRALLSYLFEPMRQLRENFADAPPRGGAR